MDKQPCRGQTGLEYIMVIALIVLIALLAVLMGNSTMQNAAHTISTVTIIPK